MIKVLERATERVNIVVNKDLENSKEEQSDSETLLTGVKLRSTVMQFIAEVMDTEFLDKSFSMLYLFTNIS